MAKKNVSIRNLQYVLLVNLFEKKHRNLYNKKKSLKNSKILLKIMYATFFSKDF